MTRDAIIAELLPPSRSGSRPDRQGWAASRTLATRMLKAGWASRKCAWPGSARTVLRAQGHAAIFPPSTAHARLLRARRNAASSLPARHQQRSLRCCVRKRGISFVRMSSLLSVSLMREALRFWCRDEEDALDERKPAGRWQTGQQGKIASQNSSEIST